MANELELIKSETKAKTDGASLVRILNRMIRTYKTAQRTTPPMTNNFNESTEESKVDCSKQGARSRSRSQEAQENHCKWSYPISSHFKNQDYGNWSEIIESETIWDIAIIKIKIRGREKE